MPHTSSLRRIYAFSDTYGRSKNPFTQDDADALISTDFRSFPLEEVRRSFDIYGRETIVNHILRLIFALHDGIKEADYFSADVKQQFADSITGIFINAAPRLNTKENGALFYVATAENIRIVTTDLRCLSSLKDRIQTLAHLPNTGNKIYGPTEQFRSSYTASLLYPDHGQELIEDKVDSIPDYPDDRWELAYVDRFGNLVTYCKNPEKKWEEIMEQIKGEKNAKVVIGNVSQRVQIGSSLKDADPGSLVMYINNDIDILRKWEPDEDSYTRLYRSAFFQFSKPEIGAEIKIPKKG